MHVELISTTKTNNKVIHGSENGKRTGCGINLSKPENIGLYTSIGTMNDVAQMTCEKCKTVIAKHLIRESNKEMAAQLKEEQKMLKKERAEAKSRGKNAQQPAPPPVAPRGSSPSSASGEYVPPSMRRQMQLKQKEQPIEAPAPEAAKPISVPAPNAGLPSVASMQSTAPQRNGDDVLAQFAMPGSAMTPPPAAPAGNDVLSQFAMPAPAPAMPNDDVLAQFAMPGTPPASSQPPMRPSANDDVLAQFAMPGTPPASSQPPMRPSANDDVLAQFAMPTGTPTAAMPAARPNQPDDVLSQFALPNVPSAVPNVPAGHPDAVTATNADELLANFNVPTAPAPAPQPAAPIMENPEDILAQFSVPTQPKRGKPVTELDTLADTLFGGEPAPSVLPTQPVTPTVTVPEVPAMPQRPLPPAEEILDVMPTPAADGLDAFTVPTAPAAPAAPILDDLSSFTVPTAPVSAAPAAPMVDDLSSFTVPTAPVSAAPASSLGDSLDDLLLMPGAGEPEPEEVPVFATVPSTPPVSADVPVLDVPQAPVLNVPRTPVLNTPASAPAPIVPDLTTVPNVPIGQTAAQASVPVLDAPTAPPVMQAPPVAPIPAPAPIPPVPPVPPVYPTGYGVPTVPTYAQPYAQPAVNPYAIPPQPKAEEPEGSKPLFVGYSADGRQLFQTYDELGNPIPINEPVYSAPPEAPKSGAVVPGTGAPIMDMDDLMASMGIQTKKEEAASQGKEIHYSEYHLPEKKKRPAAQKKVPASAQVDDTPKGPISAAEAKRRKKVEKINRDFEKQLRARGIDPRTGGIIDPKK